MVAASQWQTEIRSEQLEARVSLSHRLRCWMRLWYEPWHNIHRSWIERGDPNLARLLATGSLGCRNARAALFELLGLGDDSSAPPPETLRRLDPIPLDPTLMQDHALRLGVAVVGNDQTFKAMWLYRSSALRTLATQEIWRTGLQLAAARHVPVRGVLSEHLKLEPERAIRAVGLASMRYVADGVAPGLWQRLRFQFDIKAVELANDYQIGPSSSQPQDEHACARHLIRAWSMAGHTQRASISEASEPN